PSQEILIAVVEGETDETPREIALNVAPMHFVERHHVNARTREPPQHAIEKLRRNLQKPVRLERLCLFRPHMVQRQDGADTAHERTQQMMSPAEIPRFQPGADDRFSHSRLGPLLPRPFNLLSRRSVENSLRAGSTLVRPVKVQAWYPCLTRAGTSL